MNGTAHFLGKGDHFVFTLLLRALSVDLFCLGIMGTRQFEPGVNMSSSVVLTKVLTSAPTLKYLRRGQNQGG